MQVTWCKQYCFVHPHGRGETSESRRVSTAHGTHQASAPTGGTGPQNGGTWRGIYKCVEGIGPTHAWEGERELRREKRDVYGVVRPMYTGWG
jgi:hypothetical protein